MVARKTGVPVDFFRPVLIKEEVFLSAFKSNSDYMVKTISQLVQVSFTHYCASTPCLSTS